MSIESEITRIQNAKSDIRDAIEDKGVTVPSSELIDTYDNYIAQIQTIGTYQEKQVTPTMLSQEVVADAGYDALSKVTVNGDANLISSNIKDGTQIFGVTGNYVTPTNYQSKQVTPIAAGLNVTADAGYDALSSVSIAGDQNLIAGNVKKDVTIFDVTGTYEATPRNLSRKKCNTYCWWFNSNTRHGI